MPISKDTKEAVQSFVRDLEKQREALKKQFEESQSRADVSSKEAARIKGQMDEISRRIKDMKKDIE